jgi:hypothetical protein
VVYLPCRPAAGEEPARVEMYRLEDGRVALLAYTALDRLARACGPEQAWVLYRTADLGRLDQESPYDIVVLDRALPAGLRKGGPADE